MSKEENRLWIGTAGWSYRDWYAIVYPERPGKHFKELDFLASFFDTVEINSTFYRPANRFMGSAWVRKTAHNPRFIFTAKLWQRFTHDRKPFGTEEVTLYTQGIDPMAEAHKLGAILCQFPWSFKNDESNRKWLSTICDTFHEYPLVVELRHASWDVQATFDFLNKKEVGFATIDQPVIGQSIKPNPVLTGKTGYVRLHGRNYKTWFATSEKGKKAKNNGSSRYDYLYSDEEIVEWAKKIKKLSGEAKQTFVIQNNHPWGQAVANSIQLKAALGESDIKIPETMLSRYPQLEKIGTPVRWNG